MKFRELSFLAVVLMSAIAGPSAPGGPPRLDKILEEVQELRDQLPERVHYLLLREQRSPTGDNTIIRSIQHGEILRDRGKGTWICRRSEEIIEANTNRDDVTKDPKTWENLVSFARGTEEIQYFNGQYIQIIDGAGVVTKSNASVQTKHPNVPFDFRMLGLAVYGDFKLMNLEGWVKTTKKNAAIPTGVTNYVPGEWVDDVTTGVAKYFCNGVTVHIDVTKDYWPVYAERPGRKKILGESVRFYFLKTTIELEKVGSTWVPSYCRLVQPETTEEIYMDWQHVEGGVDLNVDVGNLARELNAKRQSQE